MTEIKNIQSQANIKIAFVDTGNVNTSKIISSIFKKKIKKNKENEIGLQIRLMYFKGLLIEAWDTKIDDEKTFDLSNLCRSVDGIVFFYQHKSSNFKQIEKYLNSCKQLDVACTVLCSKKTNEIKLLAEQYDLFLQQWNKDDSAVKHFERFLNARFYFVSIGKKPCLCCNIC